MQLFRQRRIAAYISSVILFILSGQSASAGDSTSDLTSPSVTLKVVTPGTSCTTTGEIAETASGSYAECDSGIWLGRAASNPVYVNSAVPIGNGGMTHFVSCPAGKKVLFSSCLIYGANGIFYHDDQVSSAGVVNGWFVPGDVMTVCLYSADTAVSGFLVPVAVCGDR